mgnify:CR=1 FL=1
MKFQIFTILVVWQTLVFGQVIIAPGDLHQIQEIQENFNPKSNKPSEKGTYLWINGRPHLSTLAVVTASFKASNLPSGFIIGSRINDIITLKIPINQIQDITNLKDIRYLEIAPQIQPKVTDAVLDLRADSVHDGLGLSQSYTGKNVIIGITDWGFDYSHPMFYDTALTHTRILAAWDQFKTSGPAPSGLSYGTEYVGEIELLAAQSDTACTYYDYATHGSHVAGIAAGGGAGIGLKGVAFESNLLFTAIQLDFGGVLDAVSWMKSYANSEGKRLVINMSWGLYYLGPLDGTSLGSQALDGFINDGVVIVTSGGNNGDVNFHIKKTFNQDSLSSRIHFYPYSSHASMWGQSISMWGEQNKSFGSYFDIYQGGTKVASSPSFNTQTAPGYFDSIVVLGTDTIFYNLTTEASHPQNQKPHMRLRVKNTHIHYNVVLRSFATDGTVHYYNVTELSNGVGNWGMPFTAYGPQPIAGDAEYGIGEPACGLGVITVAAHKSERRLSNGLIIDGSIANFSSVGPTVDDRMKPDISAPGVSVESTLSSYTTGSYTPSSTTTFNGRTYGFVKFSGTSMASPATTGVVALMLEANPNLTAVQIKSILQSTAREDSETGVLPISGSTQWGFGKVNALAAVQEATRILSVSDTPIFNEVLVFPSLASEYLTLRGTSNESYFYKIFDMNGQLVLSGTTTAIIKVSPLARGTYILHLHSEKEFGVQKFVKQ